MKNVDKYSYMPGTGGSGGGSGDDTGTNKTDK